MTVKRAIKILDWCITLKTELKEDLLNPHESFIQGIQYLIEQGIMRV